MTEFNRSNWSSPEFSRGYRDNADVFIVERRRMIAILQSFYLRFVKDGTHKAVLDLGCGDGIITAAIAEIDDSLSATLVDGSGDMLAKAKERLGGSINAHYIHASFQDLLHENAPDRTYDVVVSSLAIHHLAMNEKAALFGKIFSALPVGGWFVNIDVVLAPSDRLEQWYLSLWKDWIDERKQALGITGGGYDDIIQRYKDAEENKPDTLKDQLDALRDIGFQDVDCYYKFGIFTMYGGRRPR